MNISEALKKRGRDVLSSLFDEVKQGKQASIGDAEKYVNSLIDEIVHQKEGDLVLLQSESVDGYMICHSLNVAFLSLIMAYRTGIEGLELQETGLGALLHDIGKINSPHELQYKLEAQNEYERSILAEHPVFGAHWMAQSALVSDEIISIIRKHHEAFDGKGYPDGISNRDLPRSIHIVSICNYYENLTHSVAEKTGMDPRGACFAVSRESGKRFSPKFAGTFISVMGPMLMDGPLYRKTALVLLDTREVAAVANTTSFGDTLPEIVVLTNPEGKKLQRPVTVNLKKDGSRRIVKLLRS
ncbi:MAG: HD-GYP domain-containing protein [Spirochaetota bacterium]